MAVREALTFDPLEGKLRTFPIGYAECGTVVKSEIEFREIAVQVLFFAMLVGAAHAALEH